MRELLNLPLPIYFPPFPCCLPVTFMPRRILGSANISPTQNRFCFSFFFFPSLLFFFFFIFSLPFPLYSVCSPLPPPTSFFNLVKLVQVCFLEIRWRRSGREPAKYVGLKWRGFFLFFLIKLWDVVWLAMWGEGSFCELVEEFNFWGEKWRHFTALCMSLHSFRVLWMYGAISHSLADLEMIVPLSLPGYQTLFRLSEFWFLGFLKFFLFF